MDWNQLKLALEIITGLDKDALHVHVGVLTQAGIALLMRRTLASPWPWLALLAAVLANEYYDLTYEIWPPEERQRQYLEGVRDLWNTMLMPTLLMLLCRFTPRLFQSPVPVEEPAG
jgi:hypothetical protein